MFVGTRTSKLLLSGMCLFLAVTFSQSMAAAQQMCAEVFAASSPLVPLKALSEGAEELNALLKTPQKMTSKVLAEKNEALEMAIQDYLDTMDISYKKFQTIDLVKDLEDNKYHFFYHHLYHLTGSREGGSQARMLNGLQLHPKFKTHNLKIELDPLYLFKNPGSRAHFSSITPKIVIGPHEFLSSLLATGSSLRHEVQHFIEQDKLSRGQDTLARISLTSTTGDPKIPYGQNLRADEIETHLRDLRETSNTNHQNHRDTLLSQLGFDEAKVSNIKKYRAILYNGKKEVLERAINSLRAVIQQIEVRLKSETPWTTTSIGTSNDLALLIPVQGNYDAVSVNFKGVLKLEDQQDTAKVKSALISALTWSKQRLDKVEKQIQSIERNRANEK